MESGARNTLQCAKIGGSLLGRRWIAMNGPANEYLHRMRSFRPDSNGMIDPSRCSGRRGKASKFVDGGRLCCQLK